MLDIHVFMFQIGSHTTILRISCLTMLLCRDIVLFYIRFKPMNIRFMIAFSLFHVGHSLHVGPIVNFCRMKHLFTQCAVLSCFINKISYYFLHVITMLIHAYLNVYYCIDIIDTILSIISILLIITYNVLHIDVIICPSSQVRNLGGIFESEMCMIP